MPSSRWLRRPLAGKIDAGQSHTVWLKSDGTVGCCGINGGGQCDIEEGLTYTEVAASVAHTLLLRSNGTAVAFGGCDGWQWRMPTLHGFAETPLPPVGFTMSAGFWGTTLPHITDQLHELVRGSY